MRFDSIEIPAFGPFTNFNLQFSRSSADLHLIHGANEAGKSSLLRAIHNLLYGIPARSDDNFVHPYPKLLIGATISDGENELTFLRKKGNQGTLLDADQNTLDEGKLKAFCGSVNDEFFTHMFGLSTDNLRAGASKLLSGEGELGTLLFSASLGGSPIDAALKRLQDEADQLFAGNGRQANAIVIANKAFKEFEKESRDLSTTANAWNTLQKAIDAAEADFQGKEDRLSRKRHRASHLKNLIQAIPLVTELKEIDEHLSKIVLPELPSDFPARVRESQKNLSDARILRNEHKSSRDRKKKLLDDISPYQATIDQAPDFDSLHQGIAQHQDDLGTLSNKEEALRKLKQQHEKDLKELGLETEEELTGLSDLGAAELATIEDLANSIATEESILKQAEANLNLTVEELSEAQGKLEGLGDAEITPTILDLESRIIDHNQDARVVETQVEERNQKAASLELATLQLGLSGLEKKEILDLAVPALALLEKFDQEHTQLTTSRNEHQGEVDKLNTKIIDKEADIEQTSENIAVYTDEDLLLARKERDAKWTALAVNLKDGTAADSSDVEALNEIIQKCDKIADALRNYAEILGKLATLNHDLTRLTNQRGLEENVLSRTNGELVAWNGRWLEKSHILEDREFLPTELIEWRAQWEQWCTTESELRNLIEKIEAHQLAETGLKEELRSHFKSPDASYGVLSRQLTDAISEANTAKGERKILSESITTLTTKKARQEIQLAEATQDLEATRTRWSKILTEHHLNDPGSTRAVIAALKARRDAKATHREIGDATESLSELADRIGDFQKRLADLRKKHQSEAPELDPKHPALTEARLSKVLAAAKERQTRHDALKEDIETLESDLETKERIITAAKEEIDKLISEAMLNSADELSPAITQFEKRQGFSSQRKTTHQALVGLAGSSTLEELIAEAEAAESETLKVEVDQLAPQIESLQRERDGARDALGKEVEQRTELELAKDSAIHAKQLAANALAKVVTDSERFIRLQHAIAFLQAQVEAYRDKSQGPMIKKTSEFFTTLTNDSFAGVAAQADDKDSKRINLVALRPNPDDPTAPPEALSTTALSEGTRDQLYLALRLAAIDIHLENHAPMPLILDDILMTFDDERTASVFKVLEKLSEKTQVIIFTHHQHIAELAKKFVADEHLLNLPSH